MLKFFSAPLIAGILLGVLFPFKSISLIWLSSFLLFSLLFVNSLVIDFADVWRGFKQNPIQALVTEILIFLFFPVLLTACAASVLNDRDLVFGVALSALAPCALVNPFFARARGVDARICLLHVLLSTLLCSLLTLPVLKLLNVSGGFFAPEALFYYLMSLTALPLALSWLVRRSFAQLSTRINGWLPYLNSALLAGLMFILVGSSINKLPLRLLLQHDLLLLFAFYIAMDFGLFEAVRRLGAYFVDVQAAESMALSVATRNFAASASLMLIFAPKAALPSAVGLIVHCLFFQWLLMKKSASFKH